MRGAISRLWRRLLRRRYLERDLEAELAFHREMAAEGGNAEPFGKADLIKEQSRDLLRFTVLENLWRDAVYGARGLRRSPALVLTAVLSLGFGIGANAAIFSLAIEFLFSQPSVKDPGSVVAMSVGGNSASAPPVIEFIRQSEVFADVAGSNAESFASFNDGFETRPVFAAFVTKNFFTALGIPIAHGRGILPDDPDEVVVLHDRFWRQHFHGDSSIVGRAINLEGKPYTVVGILPPGHRTPEGLGYTPDVYMPRYLDNTLLSMYARLKPGTSQGQALAALRTVAVRLDSAIPAPFKYTDDLSLTPLAGFARIVDPQTAPIAVFFALLLSLACLVLLIACVNVAGLLLARASVRKREFAIRLSLGAGRGRLLQQLLVESLMLSLLGAGCGLGLAQAITTVLTRIDLPIPIPIHLQIQVDWRLALYSALLTILATLVSGLLPARQALKESIAPDLARERKMRLRRTLVMGQLALSLVVLSTGFLFLRSLFRSAAINPGFDIRHTVRADVYLPPMRYKEAEQVLFYARQALSELNSIPGIEAAAAARVIPFNQRTYIGSLIMFPDTGEKIPVQYYWNAVSPEYFRAMDIPFIEGGSFESAASDGPQVAVVNRAFVARYLRDRTPLGARILRRTPQGFAPLGIVGVVEGTKNVTIGEGDQPQMYVPLAQAANDVSHIQFVLRSDTPPATQLVAVRQALRRVEPAAGLEVSTLYSSIGLAFLPSQIGAALMGSIGFLGLLLAAIGLYGTMAYAVTRRAHEIGIRMAVGATRGDIFRMILLDSLRLIGAGAAVGLAVALLVTKPLAMFLVPGLKSDDPLTFFAVLVVLAAAGLVASWGPLRRATAVDPLISLRYE